MGSTVAGKSNNLMQVLYNALLVMIVMFVFLVSLKLMGSSFKLFGDDVARNIINATSNPFISLFIGLLATAIIQSSSTTTSMIVAMVAAGTLNIENAVPMIMGANIGTSVTSSIVSLGHIGNKKEYMKAVSAATVHDFFNIMVVTFLFPLEYFFGILTTIASSCASFLASNSHSSEDMFSILGVTVKPTAKLIMQLANNNAWICLVIALLLLFFSLRYLTVLLKKLLIGKAEKKLDKLVFDKPVKSLGWGALLTAVVQSSSVTTSLIVPMVASNKVSLRKAFPFLMGANIGTTITALIAALSTDKAMLDVALTIAIVHMLFNILGAVLVFPITPLREIPIRLSKKLGKATMKNRLVGMAYIVITFFLIPFLLILISGNQKVIKKHTFRETEITTGKVFTNVLEDEIVAGQNALKRTIHFKVRNESDLSTSEFDRSITVSRKEDVIKIGDEMYITSPVNYCFDHSEPIGKTTLCVKKILPQFKLKENYKVDTCIVYSKNYINHNGDTLSERIFLDVSNKIVVKRETFYGDDHIKTEEII